MDDKHFIDRARILGELIQEYIANSVHKKTSYNFGLLNGLMAAYSIMIGEDIEPMPVPEEFEEVLEMDVNKVVNAINRKNMFDFTFSILDELIKNGKAKVH
jgi:hypothetical protein